MKWEVWVYDENGNPMIMQRRASREEAEEAAQRYQLRGHRSIAMPKQEKPAKRNKP